MKTKIFSTIGVAVLLLNLSIACLMAIPALAADVNSDIHDQLDPIQDVYGNSDVNSGTLSETVAKIIKIVLGFLGVIFIVLIIYAGFLWMTSAGNEEKIKTAKKIITAAIIGTAIILCAYAVTVFVIDNLISATGAD
ncbi:MAG: pilin [Patescibacteria group bacterium]|nr:pilin [Patescibacteria group bacterium]